MHSAVDSLWFRAGWARATLGFSAALMVILSLTLGLALTGDYGLLAAFEGMLGWNYLSGLVTAIAFITWSFRAHRNLWLLDRPDIRHSTEATIWWWMVPIANLYMPFRVMFEIVRGSTAKSDDPNWRRSPLDSSAVGWAAMWIGGLLAFQIGHRMATAAATESAFVSSLAVILAGSLALIGAAVAAIKMIKRISEGQKQLLEESFSFEDLKPIESDDQPIQTDTPSSANPHEIGSLGLEPGSRSTTAQEVILLARLLDEGKLSKAEYDALKSELIGSLVLSQTH